MTTAYTSLLGLALPVTGELSGTWGDVVNNSITSLVDTSVAGTTNISTDANVTLTTTTGASNQARQAILLFSGARTAIRTVTAPAQSKIYTVINATTGGFAVTLVGAGPTTGLTIPNGASATVAWNGSDFIEIGTSSIGNLTVNGNLTVTGVSTFSAGTAAAPAITTTGDTNTGIFFPAADTIGFAEGGSEVMRLDSSGNLGLGVTPSAWQTANRQVMQIGKAGSAGFIGYNTSSASITVGSNAYSTGSSEAVWTYQNTGSAASLYQAGGAVGHAWFNAPSGTAGNAITFTQAMTLDASGNLGVGNTDNAGKTAAYGKILSVTGNDSALVLESTFSGGSTWALNSYNGYLAFVNGNDGTNTERARIDSSGNFMVGTTSIASGYTFQAQGWGRFRHPSGDVVVSIVAGNTTGSSLLYFGDSASDSVGQVGYNHNSNDMYFVTNNSERARIDSSGNLLVNTTSDLGGLGGKVQISSAGSRGLVQSVNANVRLQEYLVSGSTVGFISTDGTNTTYSTASDYRLKNTITPMTGALAKVALLKPVTYKWNADGSDGEGFIAHELAEVCPQAVSGEKDAVNEDGSVKPQGIDVSFLVATLTAALQEQQAIIESLKARLDAANL